MPLVPEALYRTEDARHLMTQQSTNTRQASRPQGDVLVYEGGQVHRNLLRRLREIDPNGQRAYELASEFELAS